MSTTNYLFHLLISIIALVIITKDVKNVEMYSNEDTLPEQKMDTILQYSKHQAL